MPPRPRGRTMRYPSNSEGGLHSLTDTPWWSARGARSLQFADATTSDNDGVRRSGRARYGMSPETGGRVKPTTGPEPAETPEDAEEVTPETASMGDVEEFPSAVRKFRLRGLDGVLAGKSFDSSSDRLQIGSHPSNQIQIPDRTISRFHCELFVEPGGRVWVKDLGSRNGTRVNGTRIREAEL